MGTARSGVGRGRGDRSLRPPRRSAARSAGSLKAAPLGGPPDPSLSAGRESPKERRALTGKLPFDADSTISLIGKVLNLEPSPPAEISVDIAPALSTLILELLAKKPEDRLGSAKELRERLSQIG